MPTALTTLLMLPPLAGEGYSPASGSPPQAEGCPFLQNVRYIVHLVKQIIFPQLLWLFL
jgi:hypothetical protein